jgi:hypothetical protein
MEVVKMKCPECKNGTVYAYVFTCTKHSVGAEGEIGDPIETAAVDVSKWAEDFAECDTCEYDFVVDGDMIFLSVADMPV